MKKPNITEGPWRFRFEKHPIPDAPVDATYHVWEIEQDEDSPLHVAHVDWVEGDDDQSEANARLVSVAPKMLDELIDVYQWMIQLKHTHAHLVSEEEVESIENVLEIAGVTINEKAE